MLFIHLKQTNIALKYYIKRDSTSNNIFTQEKLSLKVKYKGARSPVEILLPHMSSCSLAFWDKFCKPYWQKICFWISWPGAVVISISKLLYLQSTELIGHNIFLACDFIKCSIMSWNLPAWNSLFAEVAVSWKYFQLECMKFALKVNCWLLLIHIVLYPSFSVAKPDKLELHFISFFHLDHTFLTT